MNENCYASVGRKRDLWSQSLGPNLFTVEGELNLSNDNPFQSPESTNQERPRSSLIRPVLSWLAGLYSVVPLLLGLSAFYTALTDPIVNHSAIIGFLGYFPMGIFTSLCFWRAITKRETWCSAVLTLFYGVSGCICIIMLREEGVWNTSFRNVALVIGCGNFTVAAILAKYFVLGKRKSVSSNGD